MKKIIVGPAEHITHQDVNYHAGSICELPDEVADHFIKEKKARLFHEEHKTKTKKDGGES